MSNRDAMKRIQGLYGIADAGACQQDPIRGVAQLLEGGCRLIQLRCKSWSISDLEIAGRKAADLCKERNATFILNDHAALVPIVGAHGVHIGQTDMSPQSVRALIGPDALIGWTTNAPEHLDDIPKDIDYMAYGPIWDSRRAGNHKDTQGLQAFHTARQKAPKGIPLVAIGGIRLPQIATVRAAGADAWAVIGAVFDTADPVATTRALVTA